MGKFTTEDGSYFESEEEAQAHTKKILEERAERIAKWEKEHMEIINCKHNSLGE